MLSRLRWVSAIANLSSLLLIAGGLLTHSRHLEVRLSWAAANTVVSSAAWIACYLPAVQRRARTAAASFVLALIAVHTASFVLVRDQLPLAPAVLIAVIMATTILFPWGTRFQAVVSASALAGYACLMVATDIPYASAVRSSAESLVAIINDILDFSKIEAGKMTIEANEFDLGATVKDVADVFAGQAHKKGLMLSCDVPPDLPERLLGDSGRVRQVLTNLVANALKFTEQGEVAVVARLVEDDERRVLVRLTVRGTGIGIPPERHAAVFESFTQVDASTTSKYGGTGLGLTICQRLVKLMNGSMGLESEVGRGSEFWIELPFESRSSRGVSSAGAL